MTEIIISVDMIFIGNGNDSVSLKKVVNSLQQDITTLYADFCRDNDFDLSKKSDIESAAMPFIKKYELQHI